MKKKLVSHYKEQFRNTVFDIPNEKDLMFELNKFRHFQFIYEVLLDELITEEKVMYKEVKELIEEDDTKCCDLSKSVNIFETLFQVLIMVLTDYGHSNDDLQKQVIYFSNNYPST